MAQIESSHDLGSSNLYQWKRTLAPVGRKHMAPVPNTWLPCPQEMKRRSWGKHRQEEMLPTVN